MIQSTSGSERKYVSPAGLVGSMVQGPVADATGKDVSPSGLGYLPPRKHGVEAAECIGLVR